MLMIEDKITELGLALPEATAPLFQYVPVVVHRDMAYVSGQLPRLNGELVHTGKVGTDVTIEQAQEAARVCIMNGLACLKQQLGSLDQIERVVKITGFVNSASGFSKQPVVMNAASELLVDIFGEMGKHSRSAVGVAELPSNAPVEIELIVAVKQ
ncbi:RidA family protein [Ammoniphilus sp. CFH 90114]|nr:RidA family protein [Ammoniphilus sp. CFH 90114]RXT13727.1 RidA family protein [Ammoniphilus sp. CFH 90114]